MWKYRALNIKLSVFSFKCLYQISKILNFIFIIPVFLACSFNYISMTELWAVLSIIDKAGIALAFSELFYWN